ncbi:hypothetical protein ACFC13_30560, partial [Streptomyces sp. NPDC056081]
MRSRPPVLIAAPDGPHPALSRVTADPRYGTPVVRTGESVLRALYEHRPDAPVLSPRLRGLDPWEVPGRMRDTSGPPIAVVDLTYRGGGHGPDPGARGRGPAARAAAAGPVAARRRAPAAFGDPDAGGVRIGVRTRDAADAARPRRPGEDPARRGAGGRGPGGTGVLTHATDGREGARNGRTHARTRTDAEKGGAPAPLVGQGGG